MLQMAITLFYILYFFFQMDNFCLTLSWQKGSTEHQPMHLRKSVPKNRTRRFRLLSGPSQILGSSRDQKLRQGDEGVEGLRNWEDHSAAKSISKWWIRGNSTNFSLNSSSAVKRIKFSFFCKLAWLYYTEC